MVIVHGRDKVGRWRGLFDEEAAVSILAGADIGYGMACAACVVRMGPRWISELDSTSSAARLIIDKEYGST
jgi:uncharacterized membrane protein (UPF0136 family)